MTARTEPLVTPITQERTFSAAVGIPGGVCADCPRCTSPSAGYCATRHHMFGNLHPVCRTCGHCVLRGTHTDDISDLAKYGGRIGSLPP